MRERVECLEDVLEEISELSTGICEIKRVAQRQQHAGPILDDTMATHPSRPEYREFFVCYQESPVA